MPGFVYLVFISSAACLVMSNSPSLAFVSGIVWGISLVLGGYFLSNKNLSLIFGLNILLLYGLTGSSNLFFLLVFGIPSFIMGLLLSAQKGYYDLQKWGMLTAVLLTSLFIGLNFYNAGNVSLDNIQAEADRYINENVDLSEDSELLKLYAEQGVSAEEFKNTFNIVARWTVIHMPAFSCILAIAAVYLILILSSYISRKKNLPILSRKPFREEKMPWHLTWVIIFALALWLWGRDEMMSLYYLGSNILVVAVPVTLYYGIAGITYQWAKSTPRGRRWILLLLIINILLLTLPAIIFIGLLGIFDSLLDYRKLDHKKEEAR